MAPKSRTSTITTRSASATRYYNRYLRHEGSSAPKPVTKSQKKLSKRVQKSRKPLAMSTPAVPKYTSEDRYFNRYLRHEGYNAPQPVKKGKKKLSGGFAGLRQLGDSKLNRMSENASRKAFVTCMVEGFQKKKKSGKMQGPQKHMPPATAKAKTKSKARGGK